MRYITKRMLLTSCRRSAIAAFILFSFLYLRNAEPEVVSDTTAVTVPPEAKLSPYSNIKKGDVSWLRSPEDYFNRLETEESQTHCRKLLSLGGVFCDSIVFGWKNVCFDPDVALDPRDCLVYSFGVENDTTFDDEVARYGCQVYMMDPTLPPGAFSWLTGRQKFLPIGIAGKNIDRPRNVSSKNPEDALMHFSKYDDIHKLTGINGPVHYLKIDIEGMEWESLQYIMDNDLLRGTRQLIVEFHVWDFKNESLVPYLQKKWLFLERLEDHGFLRVLYHPTESAMSLYRVPGTNVTVQLCGELFLVRRKR